MGAGSYRQSLLRNHAPGCIRCEIGETYGTDESNQMVWADSRRLRDRGDDRDPGVCDRAVAADVGRAGVPAAHCDAGENDRASADYRDHRTSAHRGYRQAEVFGLRNARGLAAATRRCVLIDRRPAQQFRINTGAARGRYRAPARSAARWAILLQAPGLSPALECSAASDLPPPEVRCARRQPERWSR